MARQKSLHITGVVRIMNKVRKQWAAGIPPEDAENFRKLVTNTILQVEGICLAAGQKPENLPLPTYRAYLYLKEVDLKQLPKPGKDTQKPATILRVPNLVKYCLRLQEAMWKLAGDTKNPQSTRENLQMEGWSIEISKWVQFLDRTIEQAKPGLVEFTTQARTAYQWLTFLNDPGNLEAHLAALIKVAKSGKEPGLRNPLPRQIRNLPLEATFYNIPALYKVKLHKGRLNLTANEGFTGAPEEVLYALVGAAFQSKKKVYQEKVRAYAESEEFSELLMDIESAVSGSLVSDHGDPRLEESFARVNQEFFGGKLAKPHLTWNQTITHRKFGHYVFATDTVMISVSLDRQDTPAYVLDFVMYHELLHKYFGLKTVNGRRYGHTPEFREAERRYPQFKEAQAYLEGLGRKLIKHE